MTLVKVIDSTTWAGLTELDISESDDLSNSLVNDTYRLIHSATTALVVAAVSIVSGAPAAISMTAYPASVSIGSGAVTVTSAAPAAITLTKYAADVSTGGASGNYAFSLAQTKGTMELFSDAMADPAQVTLLSSVVAGDILVAAIGERSGGNVANHVLTDNNSKTWNRISALDIDNSVGGSESTTRMTASFWWRVFDSSGETNNPPTISADDGTANGKALMVAAIRPSAAYNCAYAGGAVAGSGTAHWDGLSSGSASTTGDDILQVAVAVGRTGSPRSVDMGVDTQTGAIYEGYGAENAITFLFGINTTSQAAGSFSDSVDSPTNNGTEGVIAAIGFKDA